MEYFITCLYKKYPVCRYPEGNKIQPSKPCFKCADNPGPLNKFYSFESAYNYEKSGYIELFGNFYVNDVFDEEMDDEILDYKDHCNYKGDGRCVKYDESWECISVCPYHCIAIPCPESLWAPSLRCSIGELDENELALFKKKTVPPVFPGLHPSGFEVPKFVLQSKEELDLTNLENAFVHESTTLRFNSLVIYCDKLPNTYHDHLDIKFIVECLRLAAHIRELNQNMQTNSEQLPNSDSTVPKTRPSKAKKPKRSPKKETKTKRAPKGKTVDDRLKALLKKKPQLGVVSTAEELARQLDCSKAAIIATPTWKIIVANREKKAKIIYCGDMGEAADYRTKDNLDDLLDAEDR